MIAVGDESVGDAGGSGVSRDNDIQGNTYSDYSFGNKRPSSSVTAKALVASPTRARRRTAATPSRSHGLTAASSASSIFVDRRDRLTARQVVLRDGLYSVHARHELHQERGTVAASDFSVAFY